MIERDCWETKRCRRPIAYRKTVVYGLLLVKRHFTSFRVRMCNRRERREDQRVVYEGSGGVGVFNSIEEKLNQLDEESTESKAASLLASVADADYTISTEDAASSAFTASALLADETRSTSTDSTRSIGFDAHFPSSAKRRPIGLLLLLIRRPVLEVMKLRPLYLFFYFHLGFKAY